MSHENAAHDDHAHGHVIVSLFTLRTILTLLMFFTLLTVGAAMFEQWLSSEFNMVIPQWINVFVAISIAAVKTTLVVMFFMQLKYDNPMNTLIFVFTIFTAAFFLGFTALDLGGRSTLERFKAQYAVTGGTGLGGENKPITTIAREKAIAAGTYDPHHAAHAHHGTQSITDAGFLREAPELGSDTNRSRPVQGVTIPGLPGYVAPSDPHAHGGAAHADEQGKSHDAKSPAAAPAKEEPKAEHKPAAH